MKECGFTGKRNGNMGHFSQKCGRDAFHKKRPCR